MFMLIVGTLKVWSNSKISWLLVLAPLLLWAFMITVSFIYFTVRYYSNPPYFSNQNGKFKHLDIAFDRGSNRPKFPGVLKFDFIEGWFIVYDDGFEWKISDFKNIEKYTG